MFNDLIGCLTAAMAFPAMLRGTAGDVRSEETSFASGGMQIPIEQFLPRREGRYPAVVLVHGADGLALGPMYRSMASGLASWGYVVLLPHYFDRTGTRFSDDATNRRHFGDWLATLSDAISHAGTIAAADPARLAMIGVSLGAYLSIAQATMDARIQAVVDYYGGIPGQYAARRGTLPPMLILHGEDDRVVPVSEALRLEKLLKEQGQDHEIMIYPDQGHVFTGRDAVDAMSRTAQFLERRLKAQEPA